VKQSERCGDFVGGKYLLEVCLGVGGMGEVYRATNVSLGRKVAIKLLHQGPARDEEDILRFLREARAAALVRHPNVVDVIDVARDDDGTPFIVQELLTGEDLDAYLRVSRDFRIPAREAVEIIHAVADAVGAAHALNVIHRDLKPANIFLAKQGRKIVPKVLDFGASTYQTTGATQGTGRDAHVLVGTPKYMAPEQTTPDAVVDARSDVWALGVVLYEMIVGETPFDGEDTAAIVKRVRTRAVPPLRKAMPELPASLEELIQRCLDRDPKKRFANGAELRDELERVGRELREKLRMDVRSEPGDTLPPARQRATVAEADLVAARAPATAAEVKHTFDLDLDLELPANLGSGTSDSSYPSAITRRSLPTPSLDGPPDEALAKPMTSPPAASDRFIDDLGLSASSVLPPRASPAPEASAVRTRKREPPLPAPRTKRAGGVPRQDAALAAVVCVPAGIGFALLQNLPPLANAVGHAVAGDSQIATGSLTVLTLIVATVVSAQVVSGSRNVSKLIAAVASVLLGIVTIIATFSATEAAASGVASAASTLVPWLSPIAPLSLAWWFATRARPLWLSAYERAEGRRFVVLASVMVLCGLELSPVGAVTSLRAQTSSTGSLR
jgi:serine/threonine-protein kinase